MLLQTSKAVSDEEGSDEVIWLLEELVQLDGEEFVAAAKAAREAVSSVRKRKKESKGSHRVKRRSLSDVQEHPARTGAARFLGVSLVVGVGDEELDDLTVNRKGSEHVLKRTSIEEFRKRLLKEDEADSEDLSGGHIDEKKVKEEEMMFSPAVTAALVIKAKELLEESNEIEETKKEIQEAEAETAKRALEVLWAETRSDESPRHRGALVKTIRNDFWPAFASVVKKTTKKGAKPYYTPTSLTPRGCIGMRLFGRVWAQSAGVIIDRAGLELPEDVWCWRSGFFARTEFGVSSKTTQDKTLRPDLQEALSTLGELEEMAAAGEYEHFGVRKKADDIVPYNEVFAAIKPGAILAVFARSWQLGHLLLAMMARDCLERIFFVADDDSHIDDERHTLEKRRLAILVIDASGSSSPEVFTFSAQASLLKLVAARADPATFRRGLDVGDLSLDARPYLLTVPDALRIHACVGLADAALCTILEIAAGKSLLELNRRSEVTLRRAVAANNARAAESIVRVYAALHASENDHIATNEFLDIPLELPQPGVDDDCLRAVGAYAVLYALFSGRLAACASQTIDLLDEWLRRADSFAFRVSSWRDAANHPAASAAGPSFAAFAGKKAITNRTRFRDNLLPLATDRHAQASPIVTATFDEAVDDNGSPTAEDQSQEITMCAQPIPDDRLVSQTNNQQDPAATLDLLADLVASCHSPTLRLELLQFITGLDARWFRDLLLSSIELARDAVHLATPSATIRTALPAAVVKSTKRIDFDTAT